MTRLYYAAGRLRLKVVLALLACVGLVGLGAAVALHRFLGLSAAEVQRHLLLVTGWATLLFVNVALCAWLMLRPAARLLLQIRDLGTSIPLDEEAARAASLRFPWLLCSLTLGAGVVWLLAAGAVALLVLRTRSVLLVGMALSLLALLLLACGFLFVLSRTLIRPLTLHFRHEDVPAGLRVSIRSRVLLAVVAGTLGASLPTGLVAARRVELLHQEVVREQRLQIAEALAHSGTSMTTEELRALVASLSLPGLRLLLGEEASPTSSPLPAGHEASQVTVLGESRPRTTATATALLMIAGLALATLVGLLIGARLSRDIARVAAGVAATSHPESSPPQPLMSGAAQFSDVRRLGDAVNALLRRMAQINVANFVAIEKSLATRKMKVQFLANVSQELRSPLDAILGFTELLLADRSARADQRQADALAAIKRAGSELLHLIDGVLDFARLEAGRLSLRRADCLPAEMIRQVVQELQGQGLPEGISVHTELQAGLPTLWADPHRLAQATLYLLRFSVDSLAASGSARDPSGERAAGPASPRAGRVVLVQLSAQNLNQPHPDGARKLLLVRVTVPGLELSARQLEQLFESFRRRPGVRGLGLELPLARAIVELHGGTLTAASAPGQGTSLVASVPVLRRRADGRLRPVLV